MSTKGMEMAGQDPYGLIRVRGTDATAFLNAQLTRRVDDLAEGETGLAAWCNAKGRVQALFRVSREDDGYVLRLPASLLPLVLPRLKMFVLRSRVSLEQAPDLPDQRHHPRPVEILAGIPEVYPGTREQFLPQMLNLDRLGGIDFRKGCYPGQEIVARTQYLGQLKRRMHLFSADAGEPPAAGTELTAEDGSRGIVVDAARNEDNPLLIQAVIPIEAAGLAWRVVESGNPLKLLPLPYEKIPDPR